MPKYSTISTKPTAAATLGKKYGVREEQGDDDDDVVTLSGAQLKSLISQYASQAMKDELAKVLSTLTKNH